MQDAGFLDEVRQLMGRGDLNPELPSMRCVGYRQAWEYLSGDCDHETYLNKGMAATRQLAKRQITWLRKWPDVQWLDSNNLQMVLETLKKSGLHTTFNSAN